MVEGLCDVYVRLRTCMCVCARARCFASPFAQFTPPNTPRHSPIGELLALCCGLLDSVLVKFKSSEHQGFSNLSARNASLHVTGKEGK